MKHLRESLRVFFLGLLLLLLFPVSFADELPPTEETVRFGFLKPMDVYGKTTTSQAKRTFADRSNAIFKKPCQISILTLWSTV